MLETHKKVFSVDSKDLLEDNLDQLLTRKELEAACLKNNLELMQMATAAYQAFEIFYRTFDDEPRSQAAMKP